MTEIIHHLGVIEGLVKAKPKTPKKPALVTGKKKEKAKAKPGAKLKKARKAVKDKVSVPRATPKKKTAVKKLKKAKTE